MWHTFLDPALALITTVAEDVVNLERHEREAA
jgi:hypothetical protein